MKIKEKIKELRQKPKEEEHIKQAKERGGRGNDKAKKSKAPL